MPRTAIFACAWALAALGPAAALAAEPAGATRAAEPAGATRAEEPAPPPELAPPPEPGPDVVATSPAPVPGSDEASRAGSEARRGPAERPWAGSSLYNANSVTTGTIFRGQQLYANPTVESMLYVLPRYAFDEAFQLRGRLVIAYEYTSSDTTTARNEPVLSDTLLSLFYRKLPAFRGIQPYLAANLGLPTSKASRSRTLVVNPGATLQLTRSFEDALGGDVTFIGSLSYAHPFYRSDTAETTDARPAGALACFGGTNCSDLLSGAMNPSDTLSYSLVVVGDWGRFSPAIMYLGASQWVYHPRDVVNPVDGTPVSAPSGFERTSVRQTHYVSAWLDYDLNGWFTAEVGFWNAVSALSGTGQRANVLFDRYQDTRVYLGCSIQLDNLVQALQGGGEGEGGIVRARNERTPVVRF